jgi:hypothetical protein
MTIPFWLLRLLPMWDYICPKCNRKVSKDSIKCPHCGESYGEPLRVPPTILKNRERLEDFVHKHVFPRVSKEQREYLAQYFTELFSDGFESGNFSNWTSTTTDGGTCTVEETETSYDGDYCQKVTVTGGTGSKAYSYKTLGSSYSHLFVRVYFYLNVDLDSGETAPFLALGPSGNDDYIFVRAREDSGDMKWQVRYLDGGEWTNSGYSTETLSKQTWYCVELEYDYSSSSWELYVDGSSVLSASSLTLYSDTDTVKSGTTYSYGTHTSYIDCVVAADTYIGPEVETYTKTWTADTLFKKLGITKSLAADATFQKQGIPKTFGLDTAFQESFVIQKQIDAFFKRLDAPKTFGLDVYFGSVGSETYVKNFALDIIFAYKVRLPELWLDENGKLVLNISKPYTWVGT